MSLMNQRAEDLSDGCTQRANGRATDGTKLEGAAAGLAA